MNRTPIIIGVIIIALLSAIVWGTGTLNITGDQPDIVWTGVSCEVPDDCLEYSRDAGMPENVIAEQLTQYDLVCYQNTCGVNEK